MPREKDPPEAPKRAWSGELWRHIAALLILFWLALVYLNYYPQFYARFLP